ITIDLDMEARRARCEAAGVATGRGEPILNPVTGEEHRVGIVLPNGFEYTRNEVGRGWSESTGAVVNRLEDSYAHWCELHLTGAGEPGPAVAPAGMSGRTSPSSLPPAGRRHAAALLAVALAAWMFVAWLALVADPMTQPLARLAMPMSTAWRPVTVAAVFMMWS